MSWLSKSNNTFLENYIKEHQNDFYILAYGYVKNREAALDIVQESILKALSSSSSLKKKDAIKPWFYKIIVNTSLSYLRKNKKIIYTETLPEQIDISSAHYDDNMDLYNALDQLDAKYKSVIILRYFEDMKINDVAFVTGSNVSTVKSRIYIALSRLRNIMKGDEEHVR